MFRIYIQNGYVIGRETMHHLSPEQIAKLEGIFVDDVLIAEKRLPATPIYDGEDIVDIQELPDIQYNVDKTTISTLESATITISDPEVVTAIVENLEYEVTDGVIEYSNENPGKYEIILKKEGYYDARIQIEVVEA